ncbi:MAG: hypothetical protein JWP97_1729 [Labilithrix sp.]|nr:hypothetical protein [Labilithrix sp.]
MHPRAANMKKPTRAVPDEKTASRRHQHEAEGGLGGALAGAAVGAIAGPPGALAGAIIGGVVGALAVAAVDQDLGDQAAVDRQLDADIGVSGGDLGAPNLRHPPAVRGVYSAQSAGASGEAGSSPPEGPMQTPES